MKLTNEQLKKIISDHKFLFFNTDVTFDHVLSLAIERAFEQSMLNTIQKAAEFGEQFECDHQD